MRRNYPRVVGGSLVLGLLILLCLGMVTSAQAQQSSPLPLSPLSGGVLMAQAIRSGKVVPQRLAPAGVAGASLKCGHAPCVFPNAQASEGGAPVNEDPIAANPAGKGKQLLTGGNDYNCANIQGFYTTSDTGKTWRHHCMGNLSGLSGAGDPAVGYDTSGTAYIVGIDLNFFTFSGVIKYEKSTDNGATWSATAEAFGPFFPGGLTDKEWLQIDTNPSSPHVNNLYISVTQFDSTLSNTEITVSNSTDGGSTWTTVPVDAEQFFPTVDQFNDLAVGRDGTVYVTWMRCVATSTGCGGTTATLLFSKSTDAGATWSAPTTIASVALAPNPCGAFYGCLPGTGERVSEIPVIGVDTTTGAGAGNLYVAMYNWTGTYMQVLASTSTNGGSSWGTPVPVAPPTATHDQFFPWLNVSATGVVGVTWLDRRDDPSNISYEAFAAVSTDQGSSFGTNTKIASAMSNPFNDGFGGSFMGDYTGNTWFDESLFASWMDTRSGIDAQDEVGGMKSSR